MQSGTAEARMYDRAREWVGLLFTCTLAVLTAFWLPAPWGASNIEGGGWTAAERLFVGMGTAAMLIPLVTWRTRRDGRRWAVASIVGVVAALAALAIYLERGDRGPVSMPLTGSLLARSSQTTDARTVSKHYGPTDVAARAQQACRDIVWDHVGIVSDVWQKRSVDARRTWLKWLYVLASVVLAVAAIAVVHTAAGFGPPVAPARRELHAFICTDVTRPRQSLDGSTIVSNKSSQTYSSTCTVLPGAPFFLTPYRSLSQNATCYWRSSALNG